jgi:putative transposase
MTYFIENHKGEYPIQMMCQVFEISRSTYYQPLHKPESKRERENNE